MVPLGAELEGHVEVYVLLYLFPDEEADFLGYSNSWIARRRFRYLPWSAFGAMELGKAGS